MTTTESLPNSLFLKSFISVITVNLWDASTSHKVATIPDKKVGTASKLSPPPTYNVDNRVIFSLFVGRNAIFSNID